VKDGGGGREGTTPVLVLFQDKAFQLTTTVLFDGESGLRSAQAQKKIRDTYGLKIWAQAFFKRNMAERAIKEVKLRTAIMLHDQGLLWGTPFSKEKSQHL
jgi:hypothetical protein